MEFLENLAIPNVLCPPLGAVPRNMVAYRLVDGIPIQIEDILSHRILFPTKLFPDECIARACSIFADIKDLTKLRKIPKFKTKRIVAINIREKDGVLLKTFGDSHFSWWISLSFDICSIREAV